MLALFKAFPGSCGLSAPTVGGEEETDMAVGGWRVGAVDDGSQSWLATSALGSSFFIPGPRPSQFSSVPFSSLLNVFTLM